MIRISALADKIAAENAMPLAEQWTARTLYEQLSETAARVPERPAVTFQLRVGPKDPAFTRNWSQLHEDVTRAANVFRALGIGPNDVVAYILPNGLEAATVLLAGATAGIVNPVNPLLTPEHIAGILRESGAKMVVTLAPFPKTDLPQTVADAIVRAPRVGTVLEVDLARYLPAPLRWIVPLIRPKVERRHTARVLDFHKALRRQSGTKLDFEERRDDSICAYFHTGGTTGLPKITGHRPSGILYNGWCGVINEITEQDTLMCPLPLFHVFAAYPVFMTAVMSGAQVVLPTPQGYRGQGVIGNFWALVERHRATLLLMVPTAAAALMQRPVKADVSSLRLAISGSAAMPVELFRRFETATGVKILEGYGMTEATCLVSINPVFGARKIGSVGLPFPYTDVRILNCRSDGSVERECGTDEVGEICVRSPGVNNPVYADPAKNRGTLTPEGYLRTGDLGRIDADGYIWITGRAKEIIIRGGHNIDPAMIEDAFMHHPDVAFAGAIGQPDAHSGEVPAVYVELIAGAQTPIEEIAKSARTRIGERAAIPRHIEVMETLPKTAVGKIFKPDLRRRAIERVLGAALERAGSGARIQNVIEDRHRGLVAIVSHGRDAADDEAAGHILGEFVIPWAWSDMTDPTRS